MPQLIVDRNHANYVGLFAKPALSLWGKGAVILEGLLEAFSEFGATLADVKVETGGSPADEAVAVFFGLQGTYRFKFDRVLGNVSNVNDKGLEDFGRSLDLGEAWIRSEVPDCRFSSHLLSYAAHCRLDEGTSEEFLRSLNAPTLTSLGSSRGTGLIFHARGTESGSTVQLTIDHSVVLDGGLFVQFAVLSMDDRIDHSAMMIAGREQLFAALRELGVTLPDQENK